MKTTDQSSTSTHTRQQTIRGKYRQLPDMQKNRKLVRTKHLIYRSKIKGSIQIYPPKENGKVQHCHRKIRFCFSLGDAWLGKATRLRQLKQWNDVVKRRSSQQRKKHQSRYCRT